jgi:alkyl hydroperoxide reductase subunit F
VGSGNSALESALMMAGISKQVYVISKFPNTPENNGGFPKGENILINKLKQLDNVEIIYDATTTQISGTDFVTDITCENKTTGEKRTITTNGVMVHIGMIPNSDLVDSVHKNPAKEIIVNQKCETSIPGIFAAGDVTDVPFKQISIAVGQGAIAALAAIEYINRWKE